MPAGTDAGWRLLRRRGPPWNVEGAVKAAVHRLRRRFQSLLRQHVAETVADGQDVDDEIRHLVRALSA